MDTERTARANDEVVAELRKALADGGHDLRIIPDLVQLVLRDDAWRERVIRATGERVQFASFAQFVHTPALEGLGADPETLMRLCQGTPAEQQLYAALKNPSGRPANQPPTVNNVHVSRAQGNQRRRALQRISEQRPDLLAQVEAGELSPHAAAVAAGFRRQTVTVPATVDGFARKALRLFTREERAALCALLLPLEE